MANLPSSSDPSKWLGYLEQYSNAIQERNKPGLGALDEYGLVACNVRGVNHSVNHPQVAV